MKEHTLIEQHFLPVIIDPFSGIHIINRMKLVYRCQRRYMLSDTISIKNIFIPSLRATHFDISHKNFGFAIAPFDRSMRGVCATMEL